MSMCKPYLRVELDGGGGGGGGETLGAVTVTTDVSEKPLAVAITRYVPALLPVV
jgi:hypothetical protein